MAKREGTPRIAFDVEQVGKVPMRMKLSRKHLILLLQDHSDQLLAVPEDAEFHIAIPSGGDWSGTRMKIDGDTVIEVTWQR